MRRRFQITAVKTERIQVRMAATHCPICVAQTELLTTVQAAALAQVHPSQVQIWHEAGQTHGANTPDGDYRICRNSLLAFFDRNQKALAAANE